MRTATYKTFTLITGASGGLGAEFARLCAADGRNLILVGRQSDKLKRLCAELGHDITIHIIVQDLAERSAAQKIYTRIRSQHAHINQLINCAGVGDYREFVRSDLGRQERMIGVNITALTALTHLFLPAMKKQKHGRILNISSLAAFAPLPKMSVYAAAKSYVLSFSEALSEELRGSGVTVTCLCPGPVKTGFSQAARVPGNHPLARTTTPAKPIARAGYRAMLTGTPLAIPGLKPKLLIAGYRLVPRSVLRRWMAKYGIGR